MIWTEFQEFMDQNPHLGECLGWYINGQVQGVGPQEAARRPPHKAYRNRAAKAGMGTRTSTDAQNTRRLRTARRTHTVGHTGPVLFRAFLHYLKRLPGTLPCYT